MLKVKKRNVIAIIPARGGSKSIKNKNLSLINNKPLIYYSIQSAKNSKFVNRVIVSTDCKKIANVAKKYKAEVPFLRPSKISKDKTADYPVILHAILKLKLNQKEFENDIILYLRPTQPLRSSSDIDNCISVIKKNSKINCVRTIRKAIYPPFWMKKINNKNLIMPFINNKYSTKIIRRQELPSVYMCDGYADAFKIKAFLKEKKFPLTNSHGVFSKSKFFIDIDERKDIKLADLIFKNKLT